MMLLKRVGSLALILGLGLGCKSASDQALDSVMANSDKPKLSDSAKKDNLNIDSRAFVLGQAPDFSFETLDGKKVKLSDYKGKIILIDFWATWCPPCKKGLPFTERMNKELSSRGLTVLGISNEPPNVIRAYTKEHKYTFTSFSDPEQNGMSAIVSDGYPTTVIIDKNFNVVAKEVGLGPQAETIDALKKAGLDVSGFEPKNDPTAG